MKTRKAPKLHKPSGGGGRRTRSRRRSSRPTRPTCRFQASDTTDSALKRRNREQRTTSTAASKASFGWSSDSEDAAGEGGGAPASRGGTDHNADDTLGRVSSLLQEQSGDLVRRTFRIGAVGSTSARRSVYRWSHQTDGEDSEDDEENNVRSRFGGGPADIDPTSIDPTVGFHSVGGLSGHISALKEMVIFPLLYPEVFDTFKIQPPRGCLFYGPPGTGKTLVARALANECCHGDRRVSFFMRKGADCLSKWVGESERQLRLLFQQAYRLRPSIIFFDEVDGLAPVRSSRQDQIHSSIVSTLLSLMDGLDSRGEVVVIGATNRLDSIDPALRRPGRFDREFLFALPDRESRKEILKIHTQQWTPRPSEDFLEELAERCVGYCGADISAVCTEAALCALRRRYPQIYSSPHKLLLDVSSISISGEDFAAAMRKMSPASRRSNASPARPLPATVRPLLGGALQDALRALHRLFPHAKQGKGAEPDLTAGVLDDGLTGASAGTTSISEPGTGKVLHFSRSAVQQPTSHRPRLLLVGRPGAGQASHLGPAVLHALEPLPVHNLDSALLFGLSSSSPEESCAQMFSEARRTSPSVLYVPHIQQWWDTGGPVLRASFLSLLGSIPSFSPVMLLATCSVPYEDLDSEIQSLFREEYGEVFSLGVPSQKERTEFFRDLILNQAAEAPPSGGTTETRVPEVPLPAPPPSSRRLTDQERLRLEEQEEGVLRELRLFLRSVTERLSLDPRFRTFSQLVDPAQVPEPPRPPMDFSRLLDNIDEQKYSTVGQFLSDAELMWKNLLDLQPLDGSVRHRAFALRDAVRAVVRDELDPEFERVCEEISEARFKTGHQFHKEPHRFSTPGSQLRRKKSSRRPRRSKWSAGILPKPKKKKLPTPPSSCSPLTSDLSGNSSSSDSSDGEQSRRVRDRVLGVNGSGTQNQVPVNGFHRPTEPPEGLQPRPSTRTAHTESPEAAAPPKTPSLQVNKGTASQTERPLLVERSKLRKLLSQAVTDTEGLEVEALEKLYALLAQCVFTHRHAHDKTRLLQEMKTEIDGFL